MKYYCDLNITDLSGKLNHVSEFHWKLWAIAVCLFVLWSNNTLQNTYILTKSQGTLSAQLQSLL